MKLVPARGVTPGAHLEADTNKMGYIWPRDLEAGTNKMAYTGLEAA